MSAVCQKCRRPKATAADLIRWRSGLPAHTGVPSHADVCWIEFVHSWLDPEEEAAEGIGAELLKERLSGLRKWRAQYTCFGLEQLEIVQRQRR